MIDEKDMILLTDKFIQCWIDGWTKRRWIFKPEDARKEAADFVELVIIGKPEDNEND